MTAITDENSPNIQLTSYMAISSNLLARQSRISTCAAQRLTRTALPSTSESGWLANLRGRGNLTRSLRWATFSVYASTSAARGNVWLGKDRLAALVVDQHCAFEQALAGSRKRYPTREFRSFATVMRQYLDATREDKMQHRSVVTAVHGLVEYLQCERKRVPSEVLWEAERLECLLFLGYDPHFDGDEPPGL